MEQQRLQESEAVVQGLRGQKLPTIMFGAIVGAVAALALSVLLLPDLALSLSGTEPKAYWYLSRASGLVAYTLIWASVAMGLVISSKTSRVWPGGPTAVDSHQFLGLLGIGFAFLHGVVLVGDRYASFSVTQLLVPFLTSQYRPAWVGIGQLGFYLGVIVAFSFYVRKRMGPRTWRLLHYGSFVVYSLVLLHAVMAGTDRSAMPVQTLYWVTGASVYFLTVYRVLVSVKQPRGKTSGGKLAPAPHQSLAGRG